MTIEIPYISAESSAILDYLKTLVLVAVRLSGLFIFAPVFSSTAITGKLKAILFIVMTITVGPRMGVESTGHIELGISTFASQIAISLVFGLSLSMIMELANTAGQIAGMQFSFTLVNLLDPNSNIDTPLFSQVFQLLTTTILVSSGFDRLMISSIIRTYTAFPVDPGACHSVVGLRVLPVLGGSLLGAIQLIAPLIVATILVEVAIALLSRLSPQLPVLALTIPAKTLVGFGVLALTLGSWTLFIDRHFSMLLDFAQHGIAEMCNE